jgi:antitoxin VapB
MTLAIKDPATIKLVREFAGLTGETVTTTIRRAAEEQLQRVRRDRGGRGLAAKILEIGRRCASLPISTHGRLTRSSVATSMGCRAIGH